MSTATPATIETTANGWHKCTVSGVSAATGTTHAYSVMWRTQRTECCGELLTDWSDRLPVWIDGSYATVEPATVQCGRCGRRRGAVYFEAAL